MKEARLQSILAKQSRVDPNAGILLRLRQGDPATVRAHRIAIHGRCEWGCSFWQCGREKGHVGPCQP